MGIKNIVLDVTGLTGVNPRIVYIETDDTFAAVTTAGYLNHAVQLGNAFQESDMALVTTKTTPAATSVQVSWLDVAKSGTNWSLVPAAGAGSVTLPTIANHIATYTNATGGLSEDAATAINGGNIQAGLSATPGYLVSFPATAARGSLRFVAANSAGDTVTQITNASQAAARVYTIPDAGAASNFLMTNNAGTQTIATGSVALTVGTLTLGSAGNASSLTIFPATAANGTLILSPLNAGGAFNTTIRNSVMGQSTVYSIPDVGAATGQFAVLTGALVSGNSLVASGTAGKVADAGYSIKTVAGAAAAGGSATQNFVDAFCTAGSNVIGNWNTQANATSVLKITPGVGSFDVVSTADAGVGTFNYIITK